MKKFLALFLILALAVSLAACSSQATTSQTSAATTAATTTAATTASQTATTTVTSGWTIAYICKDLSLQWFIDVASSLEEKAKEMGAKEVIMCDASMDPEKYLKHLDNMISQKVDLIIVCPPDQKLSQVTVDKCKAANIPVFADADGLINEGKHIAPALELDAYVVGQTMGVWLGNYVNENLDLANNLDSFGYMLMTINEVSSVVPRSEGARDAFLSTVKVEISPDKIIEANYNGTSEKGFEVAAATITAHPEIKYWIVTAPNDEGAVGATRALEQAGKDKDATVVGCGAYHAKDEFKKEYSAFKAASFFDPITGDGYVIATAAIEFLRDGKEIFGEFKTRPDDKAFGIFPLGGIMVDESNYIELMGDAAN